MLQIKYRLSIYTRTENDWTQTFNNEGCKEPSAPLSKRQPKYLVDNTPPLPPKASCDSISLILEIFGFVNELFGHLCFMLHAI